MFFPTKRLILAIVTLAVSCNTYTVKAQILISDDQNFPLSHQTLSLADLGIGVGAQAQISGQLLQPAEA
jgi:hypothetical protein